MVAEIAVVEIVWIADLAEDAEELAWERCTTGRPLHWGVFSVPPPAKVRA